jgi:DNA-directed RNA polymerase specialized sigma24 family protein
MLKDKMMEESGHHQSLTSILGKSFWAAYLLTGNAARAERAVRQAIDLWDCDEENSEQLLYATVRIAARKSLKGNCDVERLLPAELCRVSELPPDIRSCFVLRMLLGLPSSTCAHILDLPISLIEQHSRDAVMTLGTFRDSNRRNEC